MPALPGKDPQEANDFILNEYIVLIPGTDRLMSRVGSGAVRRCRR